MIIVSIGSSHKDSINLDEAIKVCPLEELIETSGIGDIRLDTSSPEVLSYICKILAEKGVRGVLKLVTDKEYFTIIGEEIPILGRLKPEFYKEYRRFINADAIGTI